MTAISLIAYHLASTHWKLNFGLIASLGSVVGADFVLCSDPRPKLNDFAKLTVGLNVGQVGLCEVDFGAPPEHRPDDFSRR